jgi:hypothetical protein
MNKTKKKMEMKVIIALAAMIALCAAALMLTVTPKGGPGADCRGHGDCASGICDYIKQDMGRCAPSACQAGQRTVAMDGSVEYVCNNSVWVRPAEHIQTCKDNPYCDLSKPCEAGLKRVLREDQYDSACRESMAQMILPTVCVPCGNNVCDANESDCNCPEDCGTAASSGITGIIMLGPTCPVQRIGEVCERPYAATVVVKSAGSEITRFTSGDDGRFTVELPPGTYELEPLTEGGAMLPRGAPQTVVVQAGQLTNVTITYDTGIR